LNLISKLSEGQRMTRFYKGQHNNSFNASGNSWPFIRRSWMLGSVSPAALIRAFGAYANVKALTIIRRVVNDTYAFLFPKGYMWSVNDVR
jgi:hypothetical protein